VRKGVAALVLAIVAVLVTAGPAQAHNYVVASTPEAGSTLTELPAEFSVTTNEALLDLGGTGSGFGIDVIDADGLYYGDGCVTVDGATLSTTAAIGAPGEYTLVYQVVSADGHTVSDEFTFEWAPTGEYEASTGSATQGDCDGLYARDGGSDAGETTASSIDVGTVLWIGGALLAVGIAVGVTLVVLKPKK
jgi:copper resistance protein C